MDEGTKAPRNILVVVVFCAILGLIGLAGFVH